MKRNSNLLLSVIICTYNRSELLSQALESLVCQTLEKKNYEIIVVNNGSTDNTSDVVWSFQRRYKNHIINLVKEKRLGLGIARNTGLLSAKGKFVTFLDDDAKADLNWLESALKIFGSIKPDPLVIGGPIIPFYSGQKPKWFSDLYEADFKGNKSRYLHKGESFSGSNMFVCRSTLLRFGGFEEAVGMKGKILSVGEETGFFERVWEKEESGEIFYYSPSLRVYHLVPPSKTRVSYRLKRYFASGQAHCARYGRKKLIYKLSHLLKSIGFLILSLVKIVLPPVYSFTFRGWIVERLGPIVWCLGYITYFSGISIRLSQS